MKQINFILAYSLAAAMFCSSCATGRDMTSPHYIPDWENRLINIPSPSETSGGYWAVKAADTTARVIGKTILFPLAIVGNVLVNAYYIASWPIRYPLRGDKRLLVWYPIFHVGEEVGSDYFSKEWNRDLV